MSCDDVSPALHWLGCAFILAVAGVSWVLAWMKFRRKTKAKTVFPAPTRMAYAYSLTERVMTFELEATMDACGCGAPAIFEKDDMSYSVVLLRVACKKGCRTTSPRSISILGRGTTGYYVKFDAACTSLALEWDESVRTYMEGLS